MDEEQLGGWVTRPVRRGDAVHRLQGPWSPGVHALLRHLEQVGFTAAPRWLGIDDDGREVVSWIPGECPTLNVVTPMQATDEALAGAAQLVRRWHDAAASFVPPPGARWRRSSAWPTSGEIVCHNDLAPYNTIYDGATPLAFIDWDFAAPAPLLWDLAYAAYRFVPLQDEESRRSHGWGDVDVAGRLRLFCDEYGATPDQRAGLLDAVHARITAAALSIREWAAGGTEPFASFVERGVDDRHLADRDVIESMRPQLTAALG